MALRKVFFDRPRKPFDCLMTFLCRAWVVTPRLTRAIVPFLPSGHSQEVLENDPRVAVLEDLRAAVRPLHLLRPPAQHVAELGAVEPDLAGRGNAEALLGAALVLQLGHSIGSASCWERVGL